MADRLASVPVISQDFGISRVELSRDDDAVTLASINLQLSKLTSSNERFFSGSVNALKVWPAFAQSDNRSSRAVSRDIPRHSRMFRVSVCITKCGVRLKGNAMMAAATRETTARVGRGDYRPADKVMSPIQDPESKAAATRYVVIELISPYNDIEPRALHGLTHATCHSD